MSDTDTTKILTSIKKALGLLDGYNAFDDEVLMHINSVFSALAQLGVGPKTGYIVKENSQWKDILIGNQIENVKSYVYYKVKLMFDSASMQPSLIDAFSKMADEAEFRIMTATDPLEEWTLPEVTIGVGEE